MERKDTFGLAAIAIREAYPDIYKKGDGWWGRAKNTKLWYSSRSN